MTHLHAAGRIGRRLLVGAALAAAALPALAQEAPKSLVIIGRGSAGSTSDLAFTVMEEAIKRAFAPASVNVRRLPGTATAVPPRIHSGEAQIGHGVGESVVDAWTATRTSANRPKMQSLRYIGAYLGFLTRPSASPTLITTEKSGIRSWPDLANKRIGVGTPDSLTSTMVNVGLKGVGLSYDAIKRNGGVVATGDWNQQMDMLADGQLDAVFITGDHPSPILTQFAATNAARIVSMDEPVLKALMENYPTMGRDVLPPGVYDWQKTEAVGVQLALGYVVHKDVPEDVVYRICKQLYWPENAKVWGDVVPSWKGAEKLTDRAAQTVFIPLHPGAKRCLDEAKIPIRLIAHG
ncbi:MAG: TAXI family TRAP transporter solute-binding subunit, partial [Alphaproteobacteria bacterium]|nr:TAXI family TRAP transporter solute-binding subunit [Alphaproteobacteria bacterium]